MTKTITNKNEIKNLISNDDLLKINEVLIGTSNKENYWNLSDIEEVYADEEQDEHGYLTGSGALYARFAPNDCIVCLTTGINGGDVILDCENPSLKDYLDGREGKL